MVHPSVEDRGKENQEVRHGSPTFYKLLEEMAATHSKKSHDYASNQNPYGNYHFAGELAVLFAHSHKDAGFVGRLGEKIYRLANLESSQKSAQNESIEDTERDIAVIVALWMADRRDRRAIEPVTYQEQIEVAIIQAESKMDDNTLYRCLSYLEASRDARERKRANSTGTA